MKALVSYLQEHYCVDTPGDITWAHAVNSKARLRRFLDDPQIMMIESDICTSARGQPVAAHPPLRESDLTFEDLLQAMESSRQGLKLDFKDPAALAPCLKMLRMAALSRPVLLNADILQGNRAWPSRFRATDFIAICQELYPEGILSIGWTTHSDPHFSYTARNVDAMLAVCRGVSQVTFPVRACLLPASWPQLTRLIQQDDYSLTIWNGEPLSEDLQAWLRQHTDPARTMYDLIDGQQNPIRL